MFFNLLVFIYHDQLRFHFQSFRIRLSVVDFSLKKSIETHFNISKIFLSYFYDSYDFNMRAKSFVRSTAYSYLYKFHNSTLIWVGFLGVRFLGVLKLPPLSKTC